jgi:hypothetical protein
VSDVAGPDWGDGDEELGELVPVATDSAGSDDASPAEPDGLHPDDTEPDDVEPAYPDFMTWFAEWLSPAIHRSLKAGTTWCPMWWRHIEATARIDALWRSWEHARETGGPELSYWWTHHFEPHWSVLADAALGPFAACKDGVHSDKFTDLPFTYPEEVDQWRAPDHYQEATMKEKETADG